MTVAAGHAPEHRLERLSFFSDAVFAIAITLLVIDIHLPAIPPHATDADWARALRGVLPNMLAFALSFLLIGVLWARHLAVLSLLARFDRRLVWPNILLLMSVSFLPFSTTLLGIDRPARLPFAFYGANLLAASLFKALLTWLALRPDLLRSDVPALQVVGERRRVWLMPAASLAALLAALVIPGPNNLVMLAIPLALRLRFFRPEAAARVAA